MNFSDLGDARIVLYHTSTENYACLQHNFLDFTFQITPFKKSANIYNVQRVLMPTNIVSEKTETFSLNDTHLWIQNIRTNIQLHVDSIRKIAPRLGWQTEGDMLFCCGKFKEWILEYKSKEKSLDFSSLGLTLVPLHIGLFSCLEYLDLSNNNLRILPVELQKNPHLKSINLKGNPIIELPDWLKERVGVQVISDIVEPNKDSWAQLPGHS